MKLRNRNNSLNTPRNEYNIISYFSLGIGNHKYWVLYTKSGAIPIIKIQINNNDPLMIEHHIKKFFRD